MNEKELNLMDEALSGKRRVKLFDIDRLEILLALSGNELKVWFLHWCYERAGQESWLSLPTIVKLTGVSRSTVIRAHNRMEKTGWLVATGETAADKWEKPTRGCNLVKVYRVDDPTKGKLPPVDSEGGVKMKRVSKLPRFKITPKVYGSCSGSDAIHSVPLSSDDESMLPSEETKDKSKTSKPRRRPVPPELEGSAPDKVKARAEWIAALELRSPPQEDEVASEVVPTMCPIQQKPTPVFKKTLTELAAEYREEQRRRNV
jgi:Helix-turn-helix domain